MKKENMWNIIKLADIFTLGNISAGLIAIFAILEGYPKLGSVLILVAMVFDFLDGKVARATKKQNEFGKELDSLCDVVSFGIAPAVLVFSLSGSLLAIPLYILFVSAGALRLARFNVTTTKGFVGMPITVNGLIFPVLCLVNSPSWLMLLVMGVSTYLMVSSIRFKKL